MNSYAEDGICHNANHGTFGHECGKPATWLATKADGWQSGFCDHCKAHGDERHGFTKWATHPMADMGEPDGIPVRNMRDLDKVMGW